MSKQPTHVATITLPETINKSGPENNFIKRCFFHWPLFVVLLILSICLARYYLQVTKPVYGITASLKFKVPTTSAGMNDRPNPNQQLLDPVGKPIIVENEIEVIRSKKLISKVVDSLQLWVTYMLHGDAFSPDKDLYGSTPVKFELVKQTGVIPPQGSKMKIRIKDDQTFVLEDGGKKIRFSDSVNSSFGAWQLVPTANLKDYIDSAITISIQDPDAVAFDYTKKIKAELENKDVPFVNLSLSDAVPARGKDILNSLLFLYQKLALEEKDREAQKTLAFIDLRVDSIGSELEKIDRHIASYKSSEGLTNIAAQGNTGQDAKQQTIKDIQDVDIKLKSIETIERELDNSSKSQKPPSIPSNISDPDLTSLYGQLSDLLLRRDQLSTTLPQKNPIFISLDKQIATVQNNFKEKIVAIKASLLATKYQLQSYNAGVQKTLEKIPLQDKESIKMGRNQATEEKLFTDLLSLREKVSFMYGPAVSDSEIVDDAHAGKVKWPIGYMVYGLALLLGLAAPAALIYARISLSNPLTSRMQIENETETPVICELSYVNSKKPLVVSDEKNHFAVSQQFRMLRTNLYRLYEPNAMGRVTLLTSGISGEGKSFVSSNLAITLAYADKKTIVLDMDLRKPRIADDFELAEPYPGISNYLNGETADITAFIRKSSIAGLDILGSGDTASNSSELLLKSKLDDLFIELKKSYDHIIIDSPPVHLLTDALEISRFADATLYVVRQGFTSKNELEFINELHAENKFPQLHIVFNGIKADKYGYGYGLSNSYKSYNVKKERRSFASRLKGFFRRF